MRLNRSRLHLAFQSSDGPVRALHDLIFGRRDGEFLTFGTLDSEEAIFLSDRDLVSAGGQKRSRPNTKSWRHGRAIRGSE